MRLLKRLVAFVGPLLGFRTLGFQEAKIHPTPNWGMVFIMVPGNLKDPARATRFRVWGLGSRVS